MNFIKNKKWRVLRPFFVFPAIVISLFLAWNITLVFAEGITLVSLEPVADTYITYWEQNTPHGNENTLLFYGATTNSRRCLFKFDLTSIPDNVGILSAKFNFYTGSFTCELDKYYTDKRFYIFDIDKDFVENEATYNNYANGKPWNVPGMGIGADFNVLPYSSQPILLNVNKSSVGYSVDITELISILKKQGKNIANLAFFSYGMGEGGYGSIYSRENTVIEKRPRLDIKYNPLLPQAKAGNDLIINEKELRPVMLNGSPNENNPDLSYSWRISKVPPLSKYSAGQIIGESPGLAFDPDAFGFYVLTFRITYLPTGNFAEDTINVRIGLNPHPRLGLNAALINQMKVIKELDPAMWKKLLDRCDFLFNKFNNIDVTTSENKKLLIDYICRNDLVSTSLLTFIVTDDEKYFNLIKNIYFRMIYKNNIDGSEGLNTLLEIFSTPHAAAFVGGPFISGLGMVYDWGYDKLTEQEKQEIINFILEGNRFNCFANKEGLLYFRNDGVGVMYGLAGGVFAILGDTPLANEQLTWFYDYWQEMLKSLDIMGKGGALAEGNAYGVCTTAYNLVRLANLVYYASGENLFYSHPWFKKRLIYDAFAAYPGTINDKNKPISNWPSGAIPIVEEAQIGGDGRRGYGMGNINIRETGLMLTRIFQGTEESDIWNWVYRQPGVDQGASYVNFLLADLLYFSPKPVLKKPARLSYFDPSMGYVYIRSDWDSEDATWISFLAGPHLDAHQHLDQGSFTIFKRRDLVPKTGHYDINVDQPHHVAYYFRTVSSNGILIGDPNEIYQRFIRDYGCNAEGQPITSSMFLPSPDNCKTCTPNDGGQRTMSPLFLYVDTPETYYRYEDIFNTAAVKDYQDNGEYVSVAADITNAYNNPRYTTRGNIPKVNKVYRRLVYLRDLDLLLIADTIESTNPDFKKKILIHALERLEIGGTVNSIEEGETVHSDTNTASIIIDNSQPSDRDQITYDLRKGYAALQIKTLFPNEFQYRKIGGREPADEAHGDVYLSNWGKNQTHFHQHIKDFWIEDFSEGVIPNHNSYNWVPEFPMELNSIPYDSTFRGGYGRYRLEVEPTKPTATDYFLNILKPSVDEIKEIPPVQKIETEGFFGAEISYNDKKYTVMFSKDSLTAPVIDITSVKGDINGDIVVNVLDVQLCVNVVLGIEKNPGIVGRADVIRDGTVNVLDVQKLVNLILGM